MQIKMKGKNKMKRLKLVLLDIKLFILTIKYKRLKTKYDKLSKEYMIKYLNV